MTRPRGTTLPRLAAVAAALLVAAFATAVFAEEDAAAAAVRAILERALVEGADLRDLGAEIGMLGPPALPALFAALPDLADDFRHPEVYVLAVGAFGRLPATDLGAFLRAATGEGAPPTAVVQALRVLAATGDAGTLDLVQEIGARLGEAPLAVASQRGLVVAAYAGIVGRAEPAALPLTRVWGTLGEGWREALLDAVEQTGGPGAAEGLARIATAGGRGEPAALARIVRLPVLGPERTDRSLTNAVTGLFMDASPGTRIVAAQAAARLHLVLCFRGLVALLADAEPTVARAAHRALEEISGARLPSDPARWSEWFDREMLWVAEGMANDVLALRGPEESAVVEALGRLSYRRLCRSEFVAEVIRAADEGTPAVRRAALAALARLRAPEAIPTFLAALDAGEEERGAASAALAAISRLRAPSSPERWRALLGAPPARRPIAPSTGAK